MKKKTLTKRLVSFVTALSLSISSTIMVIPASATVTPLKKRMFRMMNA